MRKEFIKFADRRKGFPAAWLKCPWALYIIGADGGFWAFESEDDYQAWRGARRGAK